MNLGSDAKLARTMAVGRSGGMLLTFDVELARHIVHERKNFVERNQYVDRRDHARKVLAVNVVT